MLAHWTKSVNLVNIMPAEHQHISIVIVRMLQSMLALAFSLKNLRASCIAVDFHYC